MITLYDHPRSGNCHKVRLFLSVLGLAYEACSSTCSLTSITSRGSTGSIPFSRYRCWSTTALRSRTVRRSWSI